MVQAQPSRSLAPRNLQQLVDDLDLDAFDWNAFQSTYKGRALITRVISVAELLLHDAARAPPKALQIARTALLRALPYIKESTWDYNTYQMVVSSIDVSLNPIRSGTVGDEAMDLDVSTAAAENGGKGEEEGKSDMVWVANAEDTERKEVARLTIELSGYTSNLIKESIRLTHLAFAQLYIKTGSLNGALKHYMSAREHCSGPSHLVELGQDIIETSLTFNQVVALPGHISKLEVALDRLHPPSAPAGPSSAARDSSSMTANDVRSREARESHAADMRRKIGTKLHVARGLVALSSGDFQTAGQEMSAVWDEGGLGDWEGQVISTPDTAVIAALCILATEGRGRIRHLLLEKQTFRAALDDANLWLLDLVRAFVDAQYGEVMSLLHLHEPTLIFIPFLSRHVQSLFRRIRISCFIQYVKPFSTVRLAVMAQAFGIAEVEMVNEISALAEAQQIKAKIDLIDRVVTIVAAEPRQTAFTNAAKVGADVEQMIRAATFRMKLIEADVKVDPRPKDRRSAHAPAAINTTDANGSLFSNQQFVLPDFDDAPSGSSGAPGRMDVR